VGQTKTCPRYVTDWIRSIWWSGGGSNSEKLEKWGIYNLGAGDQIPTRSGNMGGVGGGKPEFSENLKIEMSLSYEWVIGS